MGVWGTRAYDLRRFQDLGRGGCWELGGRVSGKDEFGIWLLDIGT